MNVWAVIRETLDGYEAAMGHKVPRSELIGVPLILIGFAMLAVFAAAATP